VLTARSQGGGCANTDTVVVKASIIDTTIRLTGSDTFCVTSQESAVLSVAPTDRIQWYWGSSLIPGATQPDYRVTQSGTYQALLSNNEGCRASTEIKNILIEVPIPGIRYPLQYALADYPFQLRARKVGVLAEWDPVVFLNSPVIYEPVFNGSRDILYTIALKTAGGCITVDTQEIKIVKEVRILVPSAFTPNNDGLNDYLKPTPMGIKELKYFRIYNRWGQLVFDLQTNARGWDGNIGGRQQDTQVFVWVAEGIGVDDRRYRQKGTTALIR
jgi:gliding motility-associated-like protein